jgi:tRNA(Ile)-lysidine synthetase-like protein
LSGSVLAGGLAIRMRKGGEEIKPLGQTHTKKLKKLLQEKGIVPWMRERLPGMTARNCIRQGVLFVVSPEAIC